MGDAGVPQATIRDVLHHTTTRTTDRYVRSGRAALASAALALPRVQAKEPEAAVVVATGIDGGPAGPEPGTTPSPEDKTSARFSARLMD